MNTRELIIAAYSLLAGAIIAGLIMLPYYTRQYAMGQVDALTGNIRYEKTDIDWVEKNYWHAPRDSMVTIGPGGDYATPEAYWADRKAEMVDSTQ